MAIRINELRVGNWVNFSYKHKREYLTRPVIVTEIRKDYVMTDDNGLPLQLHYTNGSMQGIPLTPELLERAGFEKENEGTDDERMVLYISTPHGRRDELAAYYPYDLGVALFVHESMVGPSKEYLHQLQNLFFALTSTELEIREPVK